MSKGSRPRPFSIPISEYNKKLDAIFGDKPKKEQYIPPPLPEVVKEDSTIDWCTDIRETPINVLKKF